MSRLRPTGHSLIPGGISQLDAAPMRGPQRPPGRRTQAEPGYTSTTQPGPIASVLSAGDLDEVKPELSLHRPLDRADRGREDDRVKFLDHLSRPKRSEVTTLAPRGTRRKRLGKLGEIRSGLDLRLQLRRFFLTGDQNVTRGSPSHLLHPFKYGSTLPRALRAQNLPGGSDHGPNPAQVPSASRSSLRKSDTHHLTGDHTMAQQTGSLTVSAQGCCCEASERRMIRRTEPEPARRPSADRGPGHRGSVAGLVRVATDRGAAPARAPSQPGGEVTGLGRPGPTHCREGGGLGGRFAGFGRAVRVTGRASSSVVS